MTTATLVKRFTVQVGDQLIELPEASTRDEALRKIGLTPRHWSERAVKPRQISKGKAKASKQSHSTSHHVKKPTLHTKNTKIPSKQTNTVTVKMPHSTNGNANYCLFCGEPVLALRNTKHFCNGNCRVNYFRQKGR